MGDKSKVVKELFEDTGLYLTYDYNLRIRRETVATFTAGKQFTSVLDMPSGTGVISMPLLNRTEKLTLLDISSNMIALARQNVPDEQKNKVELRNSDFFETDIPAQSYDLVICLGLLAHVNSPELLLQKIAYILKPGGLLVIQNTDSSHPYSYLIRLYLWFKNLVNKQPYKLNAVKASFVENTLAENNLRQLACYRYNQSFLGFSNLFSNERKYRITRKCFGTASNNKNASWGSDYTYLFQKQQ
jgi:ubiquinone/menaquinone biosynthesis C-methylase UbiE